MGTIEDLSFGEICSSMWRPGHRPLQMQLVEGGSQDRSEQDKDKRAGHVPQHHKKSNYSKPPRCFLIEKSLILLSASGLRNKGPSY